MNRSLTRRERLRRRPEFLSVQRTGVRTRGRYLTLFVLPNRQDVTRLGVIATRRMGGAVRRNRSKRVAREIFRLNKRRRGFDIVVLPHRGFSDAPFLALQADYRATLRRGQRSHG
ncbi:MAG: ribonuclease P protein component [Acidobacteria bacterium]|nr:ribonuclease P protein component [Acidobacteriota bacterium]